MKYEDVKVGQRVCYRGNTIFLEGCVGTCTYISSMNQLAVEFDKSHISLHTCNGHCKEGHGWWCRPAFLNPVEEEVVDNSIPCAPLPVDVTTNDREMSKDQVDVTATNREMSKDQVDVTATNRGMSNDQVDVHIARLEDVVKTFFTIGVSRQDMLELFNDISKKHFSEKQLRDRIAKIKDKVRKCQN